MIHEEEPVLDIYDIQGHIFPGFGSPFTAVIGYKLVVPVMGQAEINQLIPEVTTIADALRDKNSRRTAFRLGELPTVQPLPSLALGFTSDCLAAWGFSSDHFDEGFKGGMLRDAEALGDPMNEQRIPTDWTFAFDDETKVDLLLIAGHSSEELLDLAISRWSNVLGAGWREVKKDIARRRPGDKEFFGFNDGISQPAMRGLTPDKEPLSRRAIDNTDPRSKEYARPGQRLLWPGSIIFGYSREVESPLEPGSVFEAPESWMRNGSYLVYRRLAQDVGKFKAAVSSLESHLTESDFAEYPEDWVSSRLVGRWPDGTPIILSTDSPDSSIGEDKYQNNNFTYQSAMLPTKVLTSDGREKEIPQTPSDPTGRKVPLMSHIRQINPRKGRSEIGPERHAAKLMMRRGVTFGPEFEDDRERERGLIFLSYQTSIVDQFRFLQTTWANSEELPRRHGRDPIIGQDGSIDIQRNLQIRGIEGSTVNCPFNGRWVIPTGGAYLFVPSISGLKHITESGNDLRRIRGIGAIFESRLAAAGVTQLKQVADWSNADIQYMDAKLKLQGRVLRENWSGQAQQIIATMQKI